MKKFYELKENTSEDFINERRSNIWWGSLSINEMKKFIKKYFKSEFVKFNTIDEYKIAEIWQNEGSAWDLNKIVVDFCNKQAEKFDTAGYTDQDFYPQNIKERVLDGIQEFSSRLMGFNFGASPADFKDVIAIAKEWVEE